MRGEPGRGGEGHGSLLRRSGALVDGMRDERGDGDREERDVESADLPRGRAVPLYEAGGGGVAVRNRVTFGTVARDRGPCE